MGPGLLPRAMLARRRVGGQRLTVRREGGEQDADCRRKVVTQQRCSLWSDANGCSIGLHASAHQIRGGAPSRSIQKVNLPNASVH